MQYGEIPNSRSGTERPATETRKYWVTGESDRVTIEAFMLSVLPAALVTATATVYRQPINIDFESSNYAIVTAEYKTRDQSSSPEVGSLRWSFETSGGTVNIKGALEHIADYPAGAPNHQGAIGVTKDGVEGTEIVIPALKINVQFTHPQGVITLAKAKALARATGTANQNEFMTFAAGEILFLGATGSDGTESPAEIGYQFAASENLQDQIIAGINVVAKDGWDYAWVEFREDAAAAKPTRKPIAVHVDRVYRRIDLTDLVGFG